MKTKLLLLLTSMVVIAMATAPARADIPAGVTLNFDASDPASGVDSSNWNSLTADSSQDWDFGSDVTLENVSTTHKITKAYRFTGVTGDNNQPHWSNYNENDDGSWEFWLKPNDTGTLDPQQTLLESGGTGDGISFWYEPGTVGDNVGTVNFTIDSGGTQSTVSAVIDTTEFCQITAVFDRDTAGGSIDLLEIYLNGVLVDDNASATTFDDASNDLDPTGIVDWTGTNNGGLGNDNGNVAQTAGTGQYDGYMSVLRFWDSKALTAAEVAENFLVLGVVGATDPSPEDGAMVYPTSTLELSWTNMDPNNPADPIYVDVWLSMDPVTNPQDGTKVLAAEPNATSVTVDASVEGTYYWQVNSYRYGSPTGDPCEGTIWTFIVTSDFPPSSVDAGVDMMTWTGQGVPLDPTVVDDGASALTYAWSAEPVAGVTVAFNPSADVEDPTVTLTKVPVFVPAVANAGFEADQGGEDYWGSIPGWSTIGRGGNWNPPADAYTGSAVPEGNMCAWAEKDATLVQVLNDTLVAPNTQYKLTVKVGNSLRYEWCSYDVQLLAGGNLLAADPNGLDIPVDSWATSIVEHTSGGAGDPNIGLPLEIRLLNKGGPVDYAEINFDDVQLLIDGAPAGEYVYDPEPSTVELTLAVNDEGNPTPVEDTMTIVVYENACLAAFAAGLVTEYDETDLDQNCATDLRDYAILAAKWLVDYKATAPAPKP